MVELTGIYQALGTNVVYIVLVVGFWLGVTTIYVPGTGLIEAGALISLAVAGLGLLVLPTNILGLGLMLVALGCFLGLVYYRHNMSLAAFGFLFHLVGSIFLFRAGSRPDIATILVANAAALAYHQVLLVPGLRIQDKASPLDADTLVGRDALVEATIDPVGAVRLDGVAWSATAEQFIEAGSMVRVVGRSGLYLHVIPLDRPDLRDRARHPNGERSSQLG